MARRGGARGRGGARVTSPGGPGGARCAGARGPPAGGAGPAPAPDGADDFGASAIAPLVALEDGPEFARGVDREGGPPPEIADTISTSPQGGGFEPPPDDGGDDGLDRRLAFFALTDLGNAERFVARFGDGFRWCGAIGWLVWDGKRWNRRAGDEAVMLAEHETARLIQAEAASIRGTNHDRLIKVTNDGPVYLSDKVAGWGRASEGANHLSAIGRRAAPMLAVEAAELDKDPFLINVDNGTLRIDREVDGYITFRPHDPADLITKLAPVAYDPEATAPGFDRFLADVQPSPSVRRFLGQWHGVSATGAYVQQLVFNWGKGRNGKSTLIDALAFVLGDYGETVPIETFLSEGRGRTAGQATPDLAILPGVRYLRTSEPDRGAKLAESLIKLVTGGEPIQARHLNRDYFRFYPQFKLTMSGNYRPEIRGNDEGIWRRMLLVPWTVTVPKESADEALPEKLRAEAPGILNWLLDGLRDWLDGGLKPPHDVTEATSAYREESDPLGRFLKACVAPSPGGRVQSSEVHRLFLAWAKVNGEREWSSTGFGRAMREAGYRSLNSHVIWWLDILLTRSVTDFGDEAGRSPDPPSPAAGGADDV